MTGKCPECQEEKEITQQGWMRGYCDDCYNRKYTCVVCNQLLTDAWKLYTVPGKGNGHKECLEPKDIDSTEIAQADGKIITEDMVNGNDCPNGSCS